MSTIKVDTIATRTGSGNITLSNNVASLTSAGAISGTNLSASGTLAVTGAITASAGIVIPSGQGIDFSATADSSGTTSSEILDDYEEGTWTPGISGRTFTSVFGMYQKIGNVVTIYFDMNTMAGADVTTPILTGLPYTSSNSSSIQYAGFILIHEPYLIEGNGDRTYVYWRISKNSTQGTMLQGGGDATVFSHQNGNVMGNGDNARGMGQYFTDA